MDPDFRNLKEELEHTRELAQQALTQAVMANDDRLHQAMTASVPAEGGMFLLQPDGNDDSGGGGGDFWIVDREGEGTLIRMSDVLENYNPDVHDDWSLTFPVSGLVLDVGNWGADGQTTRYGMSGNNQTLLRIAIIRKSGNDKLRVNSGGQMREVILCVDGEPRVDLI